MLHRTVAYDVREIEPGHWRWSIMPGNHLIQGWSDYQTRELAVVACHAEINAVRERRGLDEASFRRRWQSTKA